MEQSLPCKLVSLEPEIGEAVLRHKTRLLLRHESETSRKVI